MACLVSIEDLIMPEGVDRLIKDSQFSGEGLVGVPNRIFSGGLSTDALLLFIVLSRFKEGVHPSVSSLCGATALSK